MLDAPYWHACACTLLAYPLQTLNYDFPLFIHRDFGGGSRCEASAIGIFSERGILGLFEFFSGLELNVFMEITKYDSERGLFLNPL